MILILDFRDDDIDEVLHIKRLSDINVIGLLYPHQDLGSIDFSVLHEGSGFADCIMSVLFKLDGYFFNQLFALGEITHAFVLLSGCE